MWVTECWIGTNREWGSLFKEEQMARPIRIELPGTFHQVMSRGNARIQVKLGRTEVSGGVLRELYAFRQRLDFGFFVFLPRD
jgi:hypothetical protein